MNSRRPSFYVSTKLPLRGDQSGIQFSFGVSLVNTLCCLKNTWSNFISCLTYKHSYLTLFALTWDTGMPLKSIDIVDILGTQAWGTKQITLKFTDE